ncbi:hypothetical protein HER32_06545 [Hymenobacter sp. BT18]|uniref:hypothetical protein n=1 Tax=Hymenobacter sp. BT18 TaxID=2835648 RepID=UPI00143E6890|nr:hypothetical protein [Hymenobacter sp. BT18]QIX60851.1 hypothetical protein HER32_06545 [Hymenobacter sp. BT18]
MTALLSPPEQTPTFKFEALGPTRLSTELLLAFDRFLRLSEDIGHVQQTTAKVFFEFLKTRPELDAAEIDDWRAVTEFLNECALKSK